MKLFDVSNKYLTKDVDKHKITTQIYILEVIWSTILCLSAVFLHGFLAYFHIMDQHQFQQILGKQVRLHRKAQGLSQERLAELAEVHHTYISNIERGRVNASAYGYYRIAQVLGIKVVNLFGVFDGEANDNFDNDVEEIKRKLLHMDETHRELYLSAIKGMLPK